ncbi:hypothetical protein BDU57DRAFT_589791 [Ampelomyces quisqualis]|uniref:Uncharacterized protein n=1 Tax=Ampelomyces quisqualis TaxID=50730 RepID=A0A6A5QBQ1_AMPQU|nr:hypothetical protein BDU57DRAFT_589791 [Ampelomyces quisqualis]
MADPLTYSFYGTTIPILKNIASSAISILTTAQNELSSAAPGTFPSETELLDHNFTDMLPLRHPSLTLTTSTPQFNPAFADFSAAIDFFKACIAAYDSVDEEALNAAANKPVDVPFESMGKTLHMAGLADYFHGLCVPNAYFHLNALYMLLRSKGIKLGKGVYVGTFMSEQQKKDWAPLRG